ncbi:oligopeptide/dipeptide ABC transporter ATP-binding protein [Halorubrum sp. AD140]|uniref:ABC transporter ATP-binding protein n=1 Tax=Halorubrum sp. AD140 TaxID=3050073 RepID=UPI0031F2DFB5
MSAEELISVENLTKHYTTDEGFLDRLLGDKRIVRAVDGVDFEVREGETLGLVGESGCGKSSLGRTMLGLESPTDGAVRYDGVDLTELSESEMRPYRTDLQFIFQNPFASLNPRLTVEDIIGEALDIHDIAEGEERHERVIELLETVGLSESHATRYPHEFSGGQRQRIGIARALAVDPQFIVCDEPVSALDVSVQAQILNLLEDLQEEFGLSYLFIAHDLSVVEHIADRIAVMYLGEVVEIGPTEEIFSPPYHPYTYSLLSAIPEPDPLWDGDRVILEGSVPSPMDPPSGCKFHTRCPIVQDDCSTWDEHPDLEPVDGEEHQIACPYHERIDAI